MDWQVIAALWVLAMVLIVALAVTVYTGVTRYAKQFDPAQRSPGAPPRGQDPRH